MALQKPPTKLVANNIGTQVARYVIIHEMESGTEVYKSTFRRPNFIAKPPNKAPNTAPSKDKLAIHEISWSVSFRGKALVLADAKTQLVSYGEGVGCDKVVAEQFVLFWRESMAGEL